MKNNKQAKTETETQYVPPYVRGKFERERAYAPTSPDSITHQADAENADINQIVARYKRTGIIPPSTKQPQYADVTGLQGRDLTELINLQNEVETTIRETRERLTREAAEARQKPPEGIPPAQEPPPDTPKTPEE